jgi:hypothetical protein
VSSVLLEKLNNERKRKKTSTRADDEVIEAEVQPREKG